MSGTSLFQLKEMAWKHGLAHTVVDIADTCDEIISLSTCTHIIHTLQVQN